MDALVPQGQDAQERPACSFKFPGVLILAKTKYAFVCTDCGADSSKWQGQCPACNTWNTMQEVRLGSAKSSAAGTARFEGYAGGGVSHQVQTLADISLEDLPRFSSTMEEFDRVLGGGFVPGSVVLIGGHPGAGKSTLLLQTLCLLARNCDALYVTGEESLQQVAMRAQRLKLPTDKLKMLSATETEDVVATAQQLNPAVMVVDSIQVMHLADVTSAPGSVSQVRECAAYLTRFAKQTGTVLLLVGHVTKDGSLAGPKVLEHMIDCSIMLEGSHDSRFRTLRGIKNRFGAVNELGVFAMTEQGMREVTNPSAIFLQRSDEVSSGSVVMVVWEGTRPLLVEIQALVDDSSLGNPRRVAVGLELNRMAMLLAVLHRHGGLMVGDQDVFVNVVGGVKIVETSADLALLLAVVSSFRDRPLPRDLIVFGEVGLAGEIRPVPSGLERLREAAKHGFTKAIIPHGNAPKDVIPGLSITPVRKLADALAALDAV
jgi:DNA repair protein RadA/Sms